MVRSQVHVHLVEHDWGFVIIDREAWQQRDRLRMLEIGQDVVKV